MGWYKMLWDGMGMYRDGMGTVRGLYGMVWAGNEGIF